MGRCINFVADAVEKTVKENGKHSVAYYGSGQLGTEETHIMNKTLKGGGMLANNAVEGQPRMCMASAVVGYLYTFGKTNLTAALTILMFRILTSANMRIPFSLSETNSRGASKYYSTGWLRQGKKSGQDKGHSR